MIDPYVRNLLPKLSKPFVVFLINRRIHPNLITVFSFFVALFSALSTMLSFFPLALCLWWLSRLCDGFDGMVARASGQSSPFGAYLDITLDMAAYSLVVISFQIVYPELSYYFSFILLCYVLSITTALSLGIGEAEIGAPKTDNRGLRLGAGLAEGGETGIMYSLMWLYPEFIRELTVLWLAILIISVSLRTWLACRLLNPPKSS